MSAALSPPPLGRRLLAEGLGTALLLATVVGSGIMAERLAGGNAAIALLGNTIPTGAILVVLIGMFGPVSGAHFNPAVTAVLALRREIAPGEALAYAGAQIAGAMAGTILANLMFDLAPLQVSTTLRGGTGQVLSEVVATAGLILVILGTRRSRPDGVAQAVGLYITAAYWFTASTSFANPAVTLARMVSDTFAGIAPASMPAFLVAQAIGALIGLWLALALWPGQGVARPQSAEVQPI
jgi:glycerol uptake facilitator-like aquaporin